MRYWSWAKFSSRATLPILLKASKLLQTEHGQDNNIERAQSNGWCPEKLSLITTPKLTSYDFFLQV